MDEKLRERLERFDDDMNWAGMHIDSLLDITTWTLRTLADHLKEDVEHGGGEASTLIKAMDIVETHLSD